jgi:hypothetical protein
MAILKTDGSIVFGENGTPLPQINGYSFTGNATGEELNLVTHTLENAGVKAEIFNESDGGGSRIVNKETGTIAFTGINSTGEADDSQTFSETYVKGSDGVGSRLFVTKDRAFYERPGEQYDPNDPETEKLEIARLDDMEDHLVVPDYANAETINRVDPILGGSWVADRSGFVRAGGVLATADAGNVVNVFIDGQSVLWYNGDGGSGDTGMQSVCPITKGSTVTIRATPDQTPLKAAYCFYIPPKFVTQAPTIISDEQFKNYFAVPDKDNMTGFLPITAFNADVTIPESGFCRLHIQATTTAVSTADIRRNGQTIDRKAFPITGINYFASEFVVSQGDIITVLWNNATFTSSNTFIYRPKFESVPVPVIVENPDYSNTEVDTGVKWIDGKAVYQRVIPFSVTVAAATTTTTTIIPADIVDTLIDRSGYFRLDSGNRLPIGFRSATATAGVWITHKAAGQVDLEIIWNTVNTLTGHAILKYTKV